MNLIESFKIDIKSLKVMDLNINQVLTLIKIYFNSCKQYFDYSLDIRDIEYLRKNKLIIVYEEKNINYFLREKGKIILEKIVKFEYSKNTNTKSVQENTEDSIDNFEKKVKLYRERFNGLKIGSMGSLKDVKLKLQRWMKENPEITFKEILEAVDLYIESLNGDYRFVQRADYFIFKQNSRKEESSRLSIFIEEKNKPTVNSDWTTEIK